MAKNAVPRTYNFGMTDRIVCSCVICPQCGTWVVIRAQTEFELEKSKIKMCCPGPECGKEFEFDRAETRVFELPLLLFERRYFYRSELQEAQR